MPQHILGHDQWSPSRPGCVRSGLSGAQTMGSQRTSCPWSLLSLLDKKVPTTHLLGEPWHQPALTLLSPAVPVWRRAGDPVRPCIFQKEPFGCRQEDSTLIVTQESLISWDKTLIAVSSPWGCRWHGFHHHRHPPASLRHFGNLLPILDVQMSDWRSSWECFFSPPPAPLAF